MSAIEELGITFLSLVIGILAATRLKLPPVVGVLIAGAIIGPNALQLVKENETINSFADIGATLLLFVIGIEFSLSKIIKLGLRALLMTIAKLCLTFIIVYEIALLFGIGILESIILGALFSITSTTIFSKLIKNQTQIKQEEIALLFAVLIFEDIIAVFILAFVSSLPVSIGINATDLIVSIVKSLTVMVIAYILVQRFITKIFEHISRMKTDEVLIFASFTTAALFALLANFIGLQPSIGAFLAGSLISNLKEFKRIEKTIVPFGLFFSSFFFLSMGMHFSIDIISQHWLVLSLIVITSMVAKFASVSLSVYALEKNGKSAIFAGLTMLSVGEFSLLIAREAGKFISFDFVGLTAAAVFLTSLLSGIVIINKKYVEDLIFRKITPKTRYDGRVTANYISKIIKEIEPGGGLFNTYMKELKNLIIYAATFVIINGALLLIATVFEDLNILNFSEGLLFMIRAIIHIAIFLVFGIIVFKSIDKIISETVTTFRMVDRKHIELEKKLLYSTIKLTVMMILFFITPITISLLRLPDFFSHIAVIPLILALLTLWGILKTLHSIIKNGKNERNINR